MFLIKVLLVVVFLAKFQLVSPFVEMEWANLDALIARFKMDSLVLEDRERYQLALLFVATLYVLHPKLATTGAKKAVRSAKLIWDTHAQAKSVRNQCARQFVGI